MGINGGSSPKHLAITDQIRAAHNNMICDRNVATVVVLALET